MSKIGDLGRTTTDYFITLKQARGKVIRKLKTRNKFEVANKRTKLLNLAERVNSESPAVEYLSRLNLTQEDFPDHIALVPDGNRRWADDRQLTVGEGYGEGAEIIKDFRKWSMVENSVDVVSAFLMSTENIKRRPEEELEQLYRVFVDFFNGVAENEFIQKHGIKHEVRGNEESMSLLPDEVLDAIENMEGSTADLEQSKMVFLMPYGSRDDIVRAARNTNRTLTEAGQLTVTDEGEDENNFRDNLMLGDLPDVDLMIRTSEKRMSNFMLYENAYAELVFHEKMWPSFTESDFYESIYKYSNRDRRFGV